MIVYCAAIIVLLISGCASAPRGKSFIKSNDGSPRRLNYLGYDELVAAAIKSGSENAELEKIPRGGRLMYSGIHFHNSVFEKGGDEPFLTVKLGPAIQRTKCRQNSSKVNLDPATRQIKSKIVCDILDTLPGHFSVEVRESETNLLETYEVYPDSMRGEGSVIPTKSKQND